jgi:hypothetical protein
MNPNEVEVLRDELRRELMAEVFGVMEHRRANTRRVIRVVLLIALLAIPLAAYAVTIPNTFVNGTVADADQVNANFNALAGALNLHEPDPSAHHTQTTDATQLTSGVLPDARLSANVSLLGVLVDLGEISFDPATQAELDVHTGLAAPHHTRYTDGEAAAAVGPHVTSVDGLGGGKVQSAISVLGEVESRLGGFRFPDATLQLSAAKAFPNRLLVAPSGGDFTSIQAAIDSISPAPSDPWLIEIAAGAYLEELTLKSYVHLKGAGIGATVVRPSTLVINHVTATNVTGAKLSSLTLEDPPPASQAERAMALNDSKIEIEDVRVAGYVKELISASASKLTIRNSYFLDPFYDLNRGIYLFQSTATISGSTLDTKNCAIDADRSDLILSRSIVSFEVCAVGGASPPPAILVSHSRLAGIDIGGTARAEIVGNQIRGDSGGNVTLGSSEPCQLVGNDIDFSNSAIAVIVSGPASVIGNLIKNTTPAGDGIFSNASAQITGNSISVGGTAIIDAQAALIVGNNIVGTPITAISGSVNSVLMGNRVPSGHSTDTEERWLSSRKIRVESTAEGIEFEAGGSTVTLEPSGDVRIAAAGDLFLTGADVDIAATGGLFLSGADVNIVATDEIDLTAGVTVDVTAGTLVDVSAGSTVDVNGGLINLN